MTERFGYYARLSTKEKATYRASDAIAAVPLPSPLDLAPAVAAVEAALASGVRVRVAKSLGALAAGVTDQLGAPRVRVRVREVRPDLGEGGELHGLYTFATDDTEPQIEVWMRTKAHAKVVRFRTFLRTFLHEIVHHLDVTVLGLEDSFHTEGFFRRESSLARQLLGTPSQRAVPADAEPREPTPHRSRQLSLF